MKIGIVGAGFTGLAAAYYLTQKGHNVTIFEKDDRPGGLAIGYKEKGWNWTLEEHYHHWFTNDKNVIDLAKEINHKVIIRRPKTSSFVNNGIFQLDSPISLLKFPQLSFVDRIRTGMSIAILRYNPIWMPLEHFKAEPYLLRTMGKKAYQTLWEPLMKNKLGKYASDVSLAWFWSRVYKRTPSLAYPEGGFLQFAEHLAEIITKRKGKIYYNAEVLELYSNKNPGIKFKVKNSEMKTLEFDSVIVTLPSFLFAKITPQLPESYTGNLKRLIGIGAVNLILRLKKTFMADGTYWLSMCDLKSPVLAVVEHTNYMDKENYNNEHLVYLGIYAETSDARFNMSAEELLKLYDPWLKKINPSYKSSIIGMQVFKAPFAQPIITPNYSKRIPKFKTPLQNVFLANIEQVYPWDRGTNYAVELGKNVSNIVSE